MRCWCIDTGANVAVTDINDHESIVEVSDEIETLNTTAGPIRARVATLSTPAGLTKGLVYEGSPRLIPGNAIAEKGLFLYEFGRAYVKGPSGKLIPCRIVDGIPYIPSHVKALHSVKVNRTATEPQKVNDSGAENPTDVSAGPDATLAQPTVDQPKITESTEQLPERQFQISSEKSEKRVATQEKNCINCKHQFTHHPKDPNCPVCIAAKMPATGHYRLTDGEDRKAGKIGEKCYADLCVGWPVGKGQGERNFLAVMDECSGLLYAVPLLGKVSKSVHEALLRIYRDLNGFREFTGGESPSLRVLKTDWGGEFTGLQMRDALVGENIILDHSVPYRHVAKAERLVKLIAQGVRVLLLASGLPAVFWPYAARTFAHNKNCENEEYTKYLKQNGRPCKPRVFGQLLFVKIPEKEGSKTEPAATACAFLCYEFEKTTNGMYVTYVSGGKLKIVLVDGRDLAGVHWPPLQNGEMPMAFKIVYRNLSKLVIPNDGEQKLAPSPENAIECEIPELRNDDVGTLIPSTADGNPNVLKKARDFNSPCPACRGRNRKHTREAGCRLAGTVPRKPAAVHVAQTRHFENDVGVVGPADNESGSGTVHVARDVVVTACDAQPNHNVSDPLVHVALVGSQSVSDRLVSNHVFGPFDDSLCGRSPAVHVARSENEQIAAEQGPAERFARAALSELEKAKLIDSAEQDLEKLVAQLDFGNLLGNDFPESFAEKSADIDTSSVGGLKVQHNSSKILKSHLVRKMTAQERASSKGEAALEKEMHKMCVEFGSFAEPIESADAPDDATESGLVLLSHIKHPERPENERIYKGRAVILGHLIRKIHSHTKNGIVPGNDSNTDSENSIFGNLGLNDLAALEEARLADAWALINDFVCESIDVENGYLHEKFDSEKVGHEHYVKIPKNLHKYLPENLKPKNLVNPVWKMFKFVYGHPLSGSLFILGVVTLLTNAGFQPIGKVGSRALLCKGSTLVVVYVDDIKAVGPRKELDALWQALSQKYPFKDGVTPCTEFLGTKIIREKFRIMYDMSAYCDEILAVYTEFFGIPRPSNVPIANNLKTFDKKSTQKIPDSKVQKLVGMLLWLARTAWPQISMAVSALGARVAFWDDACARELERCVAFVASTRESRLVMDLGGRPPGNPEQLKMVLYSDADWAAPRSQSGYLLVLEAEDGTDFSTKIPLHWGSKKQSLIAESAAASETCASYVALRETLPLAFSYENLCNITEPCLILRVDNSQLISLALNGESEKLFFTHKAINVRLGFLRTALDQGWIKIEHVRSALNPANLFTKCLGKIQLVREAKLCGVDIVDSRVARATLWSQRQISRRVTHSTTS